MKAIIRERRLFQIFLSKGSDSWKEAGTRRTNILLEHGFS